MLDGVWGEQPASCVDSHHAGSDGGTSDEPDWWHFMPSMFQYLPVHMHWEYLWLWAHTHQMYTHRGIGAHADIWKEKRKLLSLFMVFTFILTVNIFPLHRHTHPSIYHISNVTVPENTVVAKSSGNGTKVFWYTLQLAAFEWLNLCDCSSVYHRNMSIIISLKTKAAWSEWKTLCQCQNFLYNSLYKPQLSERWSEL